MTYSPYGDRDNGDTRTDVDTEVHDDHDQEDRAHDDDANGHDADGLDANGHDGAATPFQRESNEDETVGGDVVDQDGNVVEAADGGERDRPDTFDAESSEAPDAVYADHANAPDAVYADHANAPDAEANADDVATTPTEAGTAEDPDGHVRTDEATATDVDAPEHVEGTVERDAATEQAMAGDDAPTEVPAGVVDEHDEANDSEADHNDPDYGENDRIGVYHDGVDHDGVDHDGVDHDGVDHDGVGEMADVDGVREPADGERVDTGYADGEPVDTTYGDGADAGTVGTPTMAPPVDTDYVAVGVAEPLTESEAADLADADRSDVTRDADSDAAVDGTAVGMMPGDAPVVDAPAQQMANAEATHDRWQQIQLGFIDDPRGSVESARSLVVEAVEARISALRDRQTALDGWQSEATPDTEVLRAAIQGYRDMLNSLTDTP
jgi:hypothetical protein